ncbi:MAG TPA: hypothetical protein VFD36_28385, partial [Kofleriaceae bacterium]|nr:hypothetical protein [Kofleriaceae bacterium]
MARRALAGDETRGGGCTLITDSFLTNDFSGDPFPTQVDASSGALLVGMQPLDGSPPQRAVLD